MPGNSPRKATRKPGTKKGAVVGSGSPRRVAQLLRARPDLQVRGIRGNVDTRLARLAAGEAEVDLEALEVRFAGRAVPFELDAERRLQLEDEKEDLEVLLRQVPELERRVEELTAA